MCKEERKKNGVIIMTDYEDIYQKKNKSLSLVNSVRFDLLTPIPYSDAFVAPMGYLDSPDTQPTANTFYKLLILIPTLPL